MQTRVSVVVPDGTVCVDGECYAVDYVGDATWHAVQWQNVTGGWIEYIDGRVMDIGPDVYDAVVRPFVRAWEIARAESLRPLSDDDLATQVRAQRNALIAACDWTMLPDAPLTAEELAVWTAYRQALRDVPQQVGFPAGVQWPEAPATVMELDGSV